MEINIQNVSMTYPNGKQALKNLSLNLRSPSLVGLLGPNGAGKSTLMKLLVAALLPTGGEILLDGQPLVKKERKLKEDLGYLPQDFGLFDELSVTQFLDYMAALKGLRRPGEEIREVIRQVNLTEKAKAKIRTLSGGQRQRVGIAQALLGNPRLLIFDEPTVGLDPEERIHFRNLFSHMAQNRLVLLSTHIIEDVQSVCGQIVVIHHGRILFAGTPALFDSAKGIRSLPPLYDRIGMIADDGFSNPMQTQIVLPKFDVKKLEEVSLRVIDIYTEAYSEVDKTRVSIRFIRTMIDRVTGRFGGRVDVVPRLYLREFVDVLDKCALYDSYNPMEKYAFVAKENDTSLKEEEKAVMEVSW